MSSVLIKGMKMPECCNLCDFSHWSSLHQTAKCTRNNEPCFADYSIEYRTKRPDWCPLEKVEPVKHGHWINYKDEHQCSCCREIVINDWVSSDDEYDYCPNCGAKMDEGEENGI